MFFDPFSRPKVPMPKVPAAAKPPDPLNTDDERAKLEDMSVGINGRPVAHEPAAVLRMHRAGFTPVQTQKTLGMFEVELDREMTLARTIEGFAADEGRPIHDSDDQPKGVTEYRRARFVVKGDELVQHGSSVVDIRVFSCDIVFVLEDGSEVKVRGLDEILIRPAG